MGEKGKCGREGVKEVCRKTALIYNKANSL